MKFTTVIVTRNSAAHVKTLHTVLKLNIRTIRAGIQNELCFVNDDPFEIADVIEDRMKTCDRIVMIHYGVNIDEATIDYFCGERALEGVGVLVFPRGEGENRLGQIHTDDTTGHDRTDSSARDTLRHGGSPGVVQKSLVGQRHGGEIVGDEL